MKHSRSKAAKIRRLTKAGKTEAEIAAAVQTSVSYIRVIQRKIGVTPVVAVAPPAGWLKQKIRAWLGV